MAAQTASRQVALTALLITATLAIASCGGGGSATADPDTMAADIKAAFQHELDQRLNESSPADEITAEVTNVDCVRRTDTTARCLADVTARSSGETMKRKVSIEATADGAKVIWETTEPLSQVFQ